jgi:hypothetical protein
VDSSFAEVSACPLHERRSALFLAGPKGELSGGAQVAPVSFSPQGEIDILNVQSHWSAKRNSAKTDNLHTEDAFNSSPGEPEV